MKTTLVAIASLVLFMTSTAHAGCGSNGSRHAPTKPVTAGVPVSIPVAQGAGIPR